HSRYIIALGDQLHVAIEDCGRGVAAVMDYRTGRRPHDRGLHFARDRVERTADDFERDLVHHRTFRAIRSVPVGSTLAQPSPKNRLELASSMMAGAVIASPARSVSRR